MVNSTRNFLALEDLAKLRDEVIGICCPDWQFNIIDYISTLHNSQIQSFSVQKGFW